MTTNGNKSTNHASCEGGRRTIQHSRATSGRGGGPRTLAGKARSKLNAIKHGILSAVVFLDGEPAEEYAALFEGFRKSCAPEGKLEEFLVEKLATIAWRYRRLLIAESAEIRAKTEFLASDRVQLHQSEAEDLAKESVGLPSVIDNLQTPKCREGLIWHKENPVILDLCIRFLHELRTEIETRGLASREGVSLLGKLYGEIPGGHLLSTVADLYARCRRGEEVAKDEEAREEYRGLVLLVIDSEIAVLSLYGQGQKAIESRRLDLEKLRQCVPDSPTLDRLMRYGASLQREFDRTLNQVERLKRTRRGQPVPPPLQVELSRR